MKRIFIWNEKPTTFDFTLLSLEGWEVEQGKPPYDIWDCSVFVGHELTQRSELWVELSQKFRGLLIYNLDHDIKITGEIETNMLRADLVTVPTAEIKDKVHQATERPSGDVRVVPVAIPEQVCFWNNIQGASPW